MRERVPPIWGSPKRPHHAPRLLVEGDDQALALSDFSRFRQAGFEVAWCSGPARRPEDCAVLRNEDCPLVRGADVVLHALSSDAGIVAAIRNRYPDTWLVQVVRAPQRDSHRDQCGPGVLSESDPVEAQVRAVCHALFNRQPGNRRLTDDRK